MQTILIIEDQLEIRENITEFLEGEGYHVIVATNGVQGVHLAQAAKPDLILCDIAMPGLDGYGVKRFLSSDISTAAIPFVFLTAKVDKQDFRAGMELGADDYLTKPASWRDIRACIETRLGKQQIQERLTQEKLDTLHGRLSREIPKTIFVPTHQIGDCLVLLQQEDDPTQREKLLADAWTAYQKLCVELMTYRKFSSVNDESHA